MMTGGMEMRHRAFLAAHGFGLAWLPQTMQYEVECTFTDGDVACPFRVVVSGLHMVTSLAIEHSLDHEEARHARAVEEQIESGAIGWYRLVGCA